MTIPPSSPRDPLALDTCGVLLQLHLIRSGASRATHEIAVYLPATLDGEAFDALDRLECDQTIIALCTDVYLDLAQRLERKHLSIYDATAPAVIAALFAAHYARRQDKHLALTLTPDQADERNLPAARRYFLQMSEGGVPVHWELLDGFGHPLSILGAVDKRATTRRTRKRANVKLADQVEAEVKEATTIEVVWELSQFTKLEAMREKWAKVREERIPPPQSDTE